MTVGVILAGGQARRMGGGDKGRLLLDGTSILDHVLRRLKPQVGSIVLNANGSPERFDDLMCPVIPDSVADFPGPLAGVLAGMDWAAEQGVAQIVTVAADTPFFPEDLVQRFRETAADAQAPIVLAGTGAYRHPTFGLWSVDLRDDLRKALTSGLRKVVLWTDAHGAATADFEVGSYDPFFNVNTPDDLEAARGMVGS